MRGENAFLLIRQDELATFQGYHKELPGRTVEPDPPVTR